MKLRTKLRKETCSYRKLTIIKRTLVVGMLYVSSWYW